MIFTIVTVSLNNKYLVQATLDSVFEQNFKDYEVLVVDGKSTDGSIELFNDYKKKHKNFSYISEADTGIYNAMNKGVKYAKGKYIYFLNLGDRIHDKNVLNSIYNFISTQDDADIVYGDVLWGDTKTNYPNKLNNFYFMCEKMICHQAIFSKRALLLKEQFDETYKICADRKWLYGCKKKGAVIKYVNTVVADYDTEGVSSHYSSFHKESIRLVREQFGILGVIFVSIKLFISRFILRRKR